MSKVKLYIICLVFILSSCTHNQNSTTRSMNEEDYQESRSLDEIAVETTFEPTLELTDEIINSSLEDLIKQEKGKLSPYDQARKNDWEKRRKKYIEEEKVKIANKLRNEGRTEREITETLKSPMIGLGFPPLTYSESDILSDFKIKYVPVTSNLAKVYYLENMGDFIRHNEKYYESVISSEKEGEQQQEQKNWDKYL